MIQARRESGKKAILLDSKTKVKAMLTRLKPGDSEVKETGDWSELENAPLALEGQDPEAKVCSEGAATEPEDGNRTRGRPCATREGGRVVRGEGERGGPVRRRALKFGSELKRNGEPQTGLPL